MWIKNDKGIWVSDKKTLNPITTHHNNEVEVTIKGSPKALVEALKEVLKVLK